MKKVLYFCIIFSFLVSCSNEINKENSINDDNDSTITSDSNSYQNQIDIDTLPKVKIDTLKKSDLLDVHYNQKEAFKQIKFPTLMIIAYGCGGNTTYKYTKPKDISQPPSIEIITGYPDCPGSPNTEYARGTFMARIPSNFSVCKTNFIIKKMTQKVPNYLELYNNYFNESLKIDKKPIQIKFPVVLFYNEGNGGSFELSYDSIKHKITPFRTIHNHSFVFNVDECGTGLYLSKLPNNLPDSTVQLIIEKAKEYGYKNYSELYKEEYGKFPTN